MHAFLQGIYRLHQVIPTHIFCVVSPEQQDSKLYALPGQAVPYVSLKHSTCRKLVNDLITEMNRIGMKVAGVHYTIAACVAKKVH